MVAVHFQLFILGMLVYVRFVYGIRIFNNKKTYLFFPPQLAGVVMLGVGIWAITDPNMQSYLCNADLKHVDSQAMCEIGTQIRIGSICLIVVGAVVMITGFLGCCGAIKESPCMLMTVSN